MSDPKYRIEGESVTELIAKAVYLLKLENEAGPGKIEKMAFMTLDGSKVSVTLSKNPKVSKYRRGIEIDGSRLG